MEANVSLVATALAGAEGPIVSLLVGGCECRANMEAPIYLSLGRSTLGSYLNSFLNITSHHEANFGWPREQF